MSEKMKEQSFLGKARRFFEPVLYFKKFALQQSLKGIFGWGNPFIHILFIHKIIEFIELGEKELFYQYMLYYLLYVLFYEFIDMLAHKWGWFAMEPQVRKFLGNNYIVKFTKLDNNIIEKIGTGKSISMIDKGVSTWSTGLTRTIWQCSGIIASFVLAFYYLSGVNILISFLFIIAFLVSLFFSMSMNKKMIGIRRKRNEEEHLYTKYTVKLIMSKFEVMQGGKYEYEKKKLGSYMDNAARLNLQMSPYFHAFYRGPYFFMSLLKLLFLYYISFFIFAGEVSIATFVGIFAVMLVLEEVTMRFIDFLKNFTKEFSMIESMWNFFDTTPQIQGYEEGNTFEYKKGSIKLKAVSYGYDSNKPVFKNFSLKIPGNQITALVGPSGGGKSTLVKLIAGYIRQDSGDILIDKQNLTETSLKSYYADVGYLTQEPSVFDGTVRENLMYGVSSSLCHFVTSPSTEGDIESSPSSRGIPAKQEGELNKEQEKNFNKYLKKIIKLAHCEFIYELPDGLDTEIGERGIKLSGGQKQRLAIAKIFLKDPKIIILDEPTSALDSLSEKKITEAMHNLFKNRTVLVIAHRLQTVKHADDIIVIENGEVIERGTHKELLKNKGFYKQMLDLQSGF